MPALMAEVGALAAATEQKMLAMGPAVPPDDGSRAALLQTLLAGFCKDFVGGAAPRARLGLARCSPLQPAAAPRVGGGKAMY